MNKFDSFPLISKELVDTLNDLIPDCHPKLSDAEKNVWYNAGRRSVVNFLIDNFNVQNQNILNNETTL